MKLNDLKYEAREMISSIEEKTREATVNYHGRKESYESNKNRATISVIGGLAVFPFIPPLGLATLAYGGVKAYQAHKDKNKCKEVKNANNRTRNGRFRTTRRKHTI